jgi:valyl-tRNA synthetase
VRSGPTPYEDTGMTDYDQKTFEEKWQKQWQDTKIYHFDFNSNKPPYSIDVPPRYASGPLHAGHAVHYTHIDFAARYKRMRGYNVFFPLCFDVNGIPIEERVERQLNITRKDIDRHEFTRLCSEFAQKNIATMTNQFIRLGESMDPSIYYQTDAEYYRRVTQISFIELFEKGYIYKGEFPVNWCPRCMTAMADAEVVYADRTTKLNTIKFYFTKPQDEQILKFHGIGKDAHGVYIEIATTRPEMLAACQIVAVHPTDERAPWLVGQTVKVPTVDKEVKIVEDEAVDPEFGSGLVMICTVGDKEDLNWVFKYKLPLEMSIDEEGRMTAITGKYKGMKIEDARKAVIEDMTTNKLLLKQEPLAQNVGVCWRCKTPVEFINAKQWFLKTIPFKQMVLDTSNAMHWYPEFMKIRLEDWVNSLEWDWVISRQRYFATPIPLWECERCGEVVLARPEDCYIDPTIDKPPVENCPKCGGPLKGCEDVFDTWMDSSISPLYNTFWHRDDKKFSQLYPMSLRPQAHDIIRTWAFYTILRCTLLTDEKPFENIMMGGFILSEDGTPMHASLGNVIDPLQVIDEYGTDAFRCYAASCALGEDNPFRRKDVVRGTKLLRKLWNVQQFIGNIITEEGKPKKPRKLQDIDQWILTKYSKLVNSCTEKMDAFDYSPAMKEIEYFLWHELADHYLEMIKGSLYKKQNVESIRYTLYTVGLGVAKLFAPFFPHLTEEIYSNMYKEFEGLQSIHLSSWPEAILIDERKEQAGETVKEYIAKVRAWKSEQGMALNAPVPAIATYASSDIISRLQTNDTIIFSTLRYPEDHQFIAGKPEIQETIVSVEPVFARLGPVYKNESNVIVQWIKGHQEDLIATLEKKGDILVSEISGVKHAKREGLLQAGYVQVKKEVGLKGKKGSIILSFDGFYLELQRGKL